MRETFGRRLLLFGCLLLIFMSYYKWSVTQEQKTELKQEVRKQLLRELCHDEKNLGNIAQKDLRHLIVNDKHGIIYCFIPKVACTHWKKVMYVLKQNEPYPDLTSLQNVSIHTRNKFSFLSSFSKAEIKVRLKHYTKFLFVRDPFVRLISAYRDKFGKKDQYFYGLFARDILRLYGNETNPPKTANEALASGLRPSFHNFIQYLLDPKTERNEPFEPHWRQMHRLCHPCLIQYDFVGHQETLQEDAQELLEILKLHNDIKFPPSYVNMTSPDSVMNWFRTVPLEDRRRLYKLYERDFQLFGYRRPDELLDG
ncbi:carbohydrate sulfotransferase 12-like isoform X1 [Cololabis saira]|uniref:carbohydrate sulfotransferase 12-like isoform X1 n=2 Tax=Cololabis saira TaxID=129043 RepID=UPI002AD32640|nr:carbohydrate sulfotransferase 12-like isoform X1 [Cololabis saira]XP_061587218.1 carbohydrate sulfotransferase 12-like isoform X1 [Cololabis saira]